MDFIDKIKALGNKVVKMKDSIQTEEATKNAFIMPFISLLGYDVFDPEEVTPELVADIGTKKGEKVDYCILKDKTPIIIIECKHWSENLQKHHSQLYRYFTPTSAKFGILTNGIVYKFYTDLDEPNKIDMKPFLEFDITQIDDFLANELKKFEKSSFDVDVILTTASELKYSREIRNIFSSQLIEPSDDFIKFFVSKIYTGKMTARVLDQFGEIVKKAFNQFINDTINARLSLVITHEKKAESNEEQTSLDQNEAVTQPKKDEKAIETTDEEKEGFFIIRSILRGVVDVTRIVYRDNQAYCAILLDDNNRKPIARLYFSGKKQYLGIFDGDKKEIKHLIEKPDDIRNFSDTIKEMVNSYDVKK